MYCIFFNRVYKLVSVIFFIVFLFFTNAFAVDKFTYDSHNKRDPFVSLITSEGNYWLGVESTDTAEEGLKLEGIVVGKNGDSYAIINGTILKIGDMIGDFKLIKIQGSSVDLEGMGKFFTIKLREEEFPATAGSR